MKLHICLVEDGGSWSWSVHLHHSFSSEPKTPDRHSIASHASPRRASTHIFLGDFGSGVLIFGRLEAIHAELLAARLNLPGVSVLWWSRRVRLNECVSCDAERRSTNHRLSLQALQQTTPSIYIVCVCQIKTRPGSVVSAYSYIQACTTPI